MYDGLKDANQQTLRYVIKRSGRQVAYAPHKIKKAILSANEDESRLDERLTEQEIDDIINIITSDVYKSSRAFSVEELQDKIEREICKRKYNIFLNFHDYRKKHQSARDKTGLDKKIEGIIDVQVHDNGTVSGSNEEVNQENSNKNPIINSVQRDYIAGEWCRHYTRDYMLDEDLTKANDLGLIHFHDMDYYPMGMVNCSLINLEDMLQNGTKISGTLIERPKSFATACTVMSQIASQVASNQFGGQSMTLAHLAPFVDVSRQKLRKHFREYLEDAGVHASDEQVNKMAEEELVREIEAGCQTIQYQLITLQSTNGQAPFITLFMYVNEVPEGQIREDLVLLIKTFLEQRYRGIKDESGVPITIAFPKLIYVLTENNVTPGSKYYELTKLAAKCSAKRLVPDYISEKVMLELKGDVYPCMGCVDGKEVITYQYNNNVYTESFERMWNRLSKYFEVNKQPNLIDFVMKTPGVKIYDQKEGFVDNYGIIRNHSSEWLRITFSHGRTILCTPDHPFETNDGHIILARYLSETDLIEIDKSSSTSTKKQNSTCHITKVEHIHKDGFSYDVTTASEHFTVSGIYSHNCRSFLTPDRFTDTLHKNLAHARNFYPYKHKYYGRFNLGVVTLNLVDIACSSNGDMEKFWKIFDERLELCHRALQLRVKHLKNVPSDVAPILWQDGAYARLKPGEKIGQLFYNGYATISLGYAGLAECVYRMIHESHITSERGKQLGLSIMQKLYDACEQWKSEENIDYSVYGSPTWIQWELAA